MFYNICLLSKNHVKEVKRELVSYSKNTPQNNVAKCKYWSFDTVMGKSVHATWCIHTQIHQFPNIIVCQL